MGRRNRLSVGCWHGHCRAIKGSAELLHEKEGAQTLQPLAHAPAALLLDSVC